MRLTRRQVIAMASGAVIAASGDRALAQIEPKPASVPLPTASERAEMTALGRGFMETYAAPALSFAVGYAGEIVHQDAWGFADLEGQEPVTPQHLFRIASVSKPITSIALLRLIEQNRVRLTDRVFGPGALLGTAYGQPPYNDGVDQITVEHLLTHTGGGWSNDNRDPMFTHPGMGHAELISWTLANRSLDRLPGVAYAYSNFGYCVLGRVIEKLTGQTYPDHVRAEVLGRCGITDMTVGGNRRDQRQAHEVQYFSQSENAYGMNVTRMDAHGGWIARPADLVQLFMHVDGYTRPPNILRAETVRTMTTASAANSRYAKGWSVNGLDNWWHNGSMPGSTTIAVRTHSGFCWAAFTNTRRRASQIDGDLDRLCWNMVRKVEGWSFA
jgi:CubicO group peptidase (beta-lactamase class C family)